ncbi:hypothetical protein PINS_up005646 [Pythium insidiosum]|nr:hypothetical protein PINS_up005646 [Pythium insidiosum]
MSPQGRKRARSCHDEDSDGLSKKCVRWSTVTVYEFGVAIGGSSIPRRGGPSIGLARKPSSVWSAKVDEVEEGTMPSSEESDDSSDGSVESACSSEDDQQVQRRALARRRRVRWLKPLERVQLLTQAGCSEKRIYRMMMESSEIAMSRRLCLAVRCDVAA